MKKFTKLKKFINRKSLYWVYFVLIIFSLLVFFGINGSSVGIWSKYFYGDAPDKALILFEPRGIRSDEWLVGSPFIISQSHSIWSTTIPQGFGSKLITMLPVPTVSFKTLFHPNTWGYFFLPIKQAFAFNWWLNDLILLIFSYLFFIAITKKVFFSVLFSLIILFSPFVQWWRGAALVTPAFGFAILYFTLEIFNYKKNSDLVKNVFFLNYFLICYLFILYPPFQVSVGVLLLLFVIGYILNNKNSLDKKRLLTLIFVSCFVLVVSIICVFLYFFEFKNIINTIQNTVYPGKRFALGGGYGWINLLNGFYNIQLLDNIKGAGPWFNQSEASNFLLMYPFIAPICIYLLIRQIIVKKIDWIFTANILYLTLATMWLFVSLPSWFSKITFLYLVPINRMLIGVGIADLFLTIYFLFKIKITKTKRYIIASFVLSLIAFGLNIYIGFYLLHNYPAFIQNEFKIILISLISGMLVFLLLQQKIKLFIFVFLGYLIISTYRINPLYLGVDSIINTPLAKKIQTIEKINKGEFKWIVYETGMLGQYFIANGVNSVSGVYLYPQIDFIHIFDPQEKYINIWNRYANVFFVNEKNKINDFELIGVDQFKINIDPCDKKLKDLKVKYYLFITKNNYSCLKEIDKFTTISDYVNYLYLYERIDY
ncbi:MAG: hypothetical protein PHE32_02365 [Candidatus Shapirobacteria bacterium]|nr:hypothetical protein [Candidatus Shapirobacteria bacterium]MDD4410515.1 hypothetical protein [Candidatus Shapirobacteria bacterium]